MADGSGPIRNKGDFTYINPLLFCGVSENKEFAEFQPMEETMQTYIQGALSQKAATNISVYYRDIDSGRWFGVSENELYTPASLYKVPIMIAYLKIAESNPTILSKRVYYEGDVDANTRETFPSQDHIQRKQWYTSEELIAMMIIHSDNNAMQLLWQDLDQNTLNDIFTDLGLGPPIQNATVASISAKSYSYFFRILYNASYLNREMSEKALHLLAQTTFQEGITAGLPPGVSVAHKFGERTVAISHGGPIESRELHDCGIVYYPEHPYLLCLMTRGNNFQKLSRIMKDISTLALPVRAL